MIGCDLVFLNPLQEMKGNRLERYLGKICIPEEKNWILNSENPFLSLGLIWSLKESAYKIWNRQTMERKLNPRKFRVCLPLGSSLLDLSFTERLGSGLMIENKVITPANEHLITYSALIHHSENNESYLFSIATNSKKERKMYWETQYAPYSKLEQSKRVRIIYQNRVESAGNSLIINDYSFSHDGAAIAYALQFNNYQ